MSSYRTSVMDVRAARRRLERVASRTPSIVLEASSKAMVFAKLENLQPIGSFKIRGAANAMLQARPDELAKGVYTASAGNMAQGVAYMARELGIKCRVVVPNTAPKAKTDAVERLGAEIVRVSFDEWWQAMLNHGHPGIDGLFIHPFADPAVMAGNGTIGLEILDDAPGVDAIVVPYGGGGLSSGIASAVKAIKPDVRVYAAEVEGSAPFAASLAAGHPVSIDPVPSFVDGIGGKGVFAEMWPLTRTLLAGSLVVSVEEVAVAIRLLVERNHVVAEGAGAASVAAALNRPIDGAKRIVCVVSGGNIDLDALATILRGEIPAPKPH